MLEQLALQLPDVARAVRDRRPDEPALRIVEAHAEGALVVLEQTGVCNATLRCRLGVGEV
jgi:hypothetical protein